MPSIVVRSGAVGLHREEGTGLHRLAVQEDGACTALARVAADVGAGQPEMVPQEVDEKEARFDRPFVMLPIHGHPNGMRCHMCITPWR